MSGDAKVCLRVLYHITHGGRYGSRDSADRSACSRTNGVVLFEASKEESESMTEKKNIQTLDTAARSCQ